MPSVHYLRSCGLCTAWHLLRLMLVWIPGWACLECLSTRACCGHSSERLCLYCHCQPLGNQSSAIASPLIFHDHDTATLISKRDAQHSGLHIARIGSILHHNIHYTACQPSSSFGNENDNCSTSKGHSNQPQHQRMRLVSSSCCRSLRQWLCFWVDPLEGVPHCPSHHHCQEHVNRVVLPVYDVTDGCLEKCHPQQP